MCIQKSEHSVVRSDDKVVSLLRKILRRDNGSEFEAENTSLLSTLVDKSVVIRQVIWAIIFTAVVVLLSHFIAFNFFFGNSMERKAIVWLFSILAGCLTALAFTVRFIIEVLKVSIKTMEEDRLVMNNVVGGTMITHFDDRFTMKSVTPMFYKMFGYNKGDLKKKYRMEFYCMLVGEDSKRAFARQKRQLREKGTADARYRIFGGDGEPIWVSSRSQLTKTVGKEDVVYTVLFDVSSEQKALEKLALAEARNRLVLEKTECCIFEWNFIKDVFEASELFVKRFGAEGSEVTDKNILFDYLHKDDEQKLKDCMRQIEDGEIDNIEIIVKLKDTTGVYTHNTLTLTSVRDNNLVPIRAIGVVVNVEDQYQKEKELRSKAAHDSLTGIYNKGTTEQMIRNSIDGYPTRNHAMIIVDVDDFKTVNDTLGHAAGDKALQLVSSTLADEFENSDIVGRIGGDEFMVFAYNIGETTKRVTDALDRIKARNMIVTQGNKSINLTLSVGISRYKQDADNYEGLFKMADLALYNSKHNGKDRYTLYTSELSD